MKNQSEQKSRMEKERNELEMRLKHKIEKLESEKNKQKNYSKVNLYVASKNLLIKVKNWKIN